MKNKIYGHFQSQTNIAAVHSHPCNLLSPKKIYIYFKQANLLPPPPNKNNVLHSAWRLVYYPRKDIDSDSTKILFTATTGPLTHIKYSDNFMKNFFTRVVSVGNINNAVIDICNSLFFSFRT